MPTLTSNSSIGASTSLNKLTESNQNSFRKLSSGSRLAIPSDDAAGVSVSANLSAALSRLQASSEGLQNVASFAQTTDGFLNTIQQQTTRLSELAQRATDGTLTADQRALYDLEFQQIKNQIGSISQNASFNGTPVFQNGSISTAVEGGSTVNFQTSTTGSPASLGISGLSIDTSANAQNAITSLNSAIQTLSTRRAQVGADLSGINFQIQNSRISSVNTAAANGRIRDLNIAEETTRLSQNSIQQNFATALLSQSNRSQQSLLRLLS